MSNIPLTFDSHLLYAHAHFPDFQLLTIILFEKRFLTPLIALVSSDVMLSLEIINLQAVWIAMRLVPTCSLSLLF